MDIQDQCILVLQQARGQLDLAKGTVTFRADPLLLLDAPTIPLNATVFTGTLASASPFKGSCKGCAQSKRAAIAISSTPWIPASTNPFKSISKSKELRRPPGAPSLPGSQQAPALSKAEPGVGGERSPCTTAELEMNTLHQNRVRNEHPAPEES
ncbi:UNVERIFIED_CONTAM: hypothetical protein FKN15_062021 [Acipenser sinensis]